jgi:sugar phosphate permease
MSSVSSDKVSKKIFDEKNIVSERVVHAPSEIDHGIVKDWDEEESAVTRKYVFYPIEQKYMTDSILLNRVDFILIPILALAFFALQMDRGNISAVLTSSITEDLNITTNQINIGTQLLSAGIVLSEIPSNIILQRIGPRVWLSGQLFAWGLVATFQAFVQSYPAYLVTRILLGFCEGGFIPGTFTLFHVAE